MLIEVFIFSRGTSGCLMVRKNIGLGRKLIIATSFYGSVNGEREGSTYVQGCHHYEQQCIQDGGAYGRSGLVVYKKRLNASVATTLGASMMTVRFLLRLLIELLRNSPRHNLSRGCDATLISSPGSSAII